MAKARAEAESDDVFAIDIDPALIEAALAAVDSRSRRPGARAEAPVEVLLDLAGEGAEAFVPVPPAGPVEPASAADPARAPDAPASDEVGPVVELPRVADSSVEAAEEERRLLQIRLRDQQERVRRLEVELARAREARDALDQQFRDLRQSAQRLQQEVDLVRQRSRKDREDAERAGEERVLRGLLDIVDNVERGVSHAQQEPSRVLAGLNMIAEQFRMLIKRLGIERVDANRGTPFDPSRHEAVLHMPTSEVEPEHVHSEVAAGFSLRGRLLRPARVVVASAPIEPE